jgi:hypothetical protein
LFSYNSIFTHVQIRIYILYNQMSDSIIEKNTYILTLVQLQVYYITTFVDYIWIYILIITVNI